MSYVDEVLELVKKKNANEPEFLQAVDEVLNTLRPVIEANEELYKKEAILERITEPYLLRRWGDIQNHFKYLQSHGGRM